MRENDHQWFTANQRQPNGKPELNGGEIILTAWDGCKIQSHLAHCSEHTDTLSVTQCILLIHCLSLCFGAFHRMLQVRRTGNIRVSGRSQVQHILSFWTIARCTSNSELFISLESPEEDAARAPVSGFTSCSVGSTVDGANQLPFLDSKSILNMSEYFLVATSDLTHKHRINNNQLHLTK